MKTIFSVFQFLFFINKRVSHPERSRRIFFLILCTFFFNNSYSQETVKSYDEQFLKPIASFSSNTIYLSLTSISLIKQNIELDEDTTRFSNYSDVVQSITFTIEDEIKKLGALVKSQTLNKDDNKFIKEIIKTLFFMKEDTKLLMSFLKTNNDEDYNKFNDYHKTVINAVEKLYSLNK